MNIDDRLEHDLIPDEDSVLSTDDEELNDETFGAADVGTDFDFQAVCSFKQGIFISGS
jgi:hypothetical protein